MIPENRIPTHPGEILWEEFLQPMNLSQDVFAEHIGVSVRHISEVVDGKRNITPQMAWLFAQALGTTPEFWMNLQSAYDLARKRPARHVSPLQAAHPPS
jgi:addiction module HigA family antidote